MKASLTSHQQFLVSSNLIVDTPISMKKVKKTAVSRLLMTLHGSLILFLK